jgi:hypothetical protein
MKYTIIITGSARRFIQQDYETREDAIKRLDEVKSKANRLSLKLSIVGVEDDSTFKDLTDDSAKAPVKPSAAPGRSGPRRESA